jgi:hypothetical protein
MNQKPVYQYDLAGRYIGETVADASPLEDDVFLLPARTTETAPPARETWPDGTWPRWNGTTWALTGLNKSSTPADDPLAKLQRFLMANPDVVAAIGIDTNN